MDWIEIFKFDPIKPLLNSKHKAIQYLTKRDLLDKHEEPVTSLHARIFYGKPEYENR
jgi:hypothetical protein